MKEETALNRTQMTELIRDEAERLVALNTTKGEEYAGNADALSNFKRRAHELGITPFQVWAVLAGKHWDAIESYCKTGEVLSEPIEGRIRDLVLYNLLLLGLVTEESQPRA